MTPQHSNFITSRHKQSKKYTVFDITKKSHSTLRLQFERVKVNKNAKNGQFGEFQKI